MAKVLLVEDDNNLREIYEARLQAEGYEIASAQDGEQALVVAKQFKPDLVISDVMMPKISGFEMLDILRNTEGLEHTRVIMLTALGQAEDKTRADSLGADRYLVKSQVTLEDIVKSAHEILDGEVDPVAVAAAAPAQSVPATQSSVDVVAAPEMAAAPAQPAVGEQPAAAAEPTAVQVAPTPAPDTDPAAVPAPEVAAEPATPVAATPEPSSGPATDTATPASEPSAVPTALGADTAPQPPAQSIAYSDDVALPPATPAPADTATSSDTPADSLASTSPPADVVPVTPPPAATDSEAPASTSATVSASEPGTAANEQQAVNEQIEDFIRETDASAPNPAPAVAVSPETSADDQLLAEAADSLSDTSGGDQAETTQNQTQTEAQDATTNTSASAPRDTDENDSVTVAHKKVIQPLDGSTKPNLDELLAREEAKESGLSPNPVATSTDSVEDVPMPPHQPGEVHAPNQPGTPNEQPKKPTDFDPHDIAL